MQTKKVLNRLGYEVIDNIGKGNYGMVKLATSKKHPKNVAIKIMDRRRMTPDVVSKFLPRELAILRQVKHPHIIQVHDVFEMTNGQVFIVMEVAVTDLFQKILELHRLSGSQAKTWFSQLLSAMVYLHQQDIVHRDLKCENVLLTADDQVKLSDFGFSRFSRGFPELSQTFCGSPEYAAPEVLNRTPYDPKKSDVWSLGVILYIMVVGLMPFRAYGDRKLQCKALKFPKCIGVEMSCQSIIAYMLQYDPSTRPWVTEVVQHPWLQSDQEHSRQLGLQLQFPAMRTLVSFPFLQALWKRKSVKKDIIPSKGTHSSGSGETTAPRSSAARVIGRFTVVAVEDQNGEGSLRQDVNQAIEKDPQSSSVLRSEVDSVSSSSSEDGLELSNSQQSIKEGSQSSPLSGKVESTSSSSSEDGLVFFSAQQSLEEEPESSCLSNEVDTKSSSNSEDGLVFFSAQQSLEEKSQSSSLSREEDVLTSQGIRSESLMPELDNDNSRAGAKPPAVFRGG
ncbi:testis-specific serine/threonine-protein kinase 6-like [Salminus brasiliensis]|uniref:testis-specific serine/threonine-protein kinase 6-like n=1 Tax=Salminus brasiliensis TaxID=930266 RepID=UPI003B836BC3